MEKKIIFFLMIFAILLPLSFATDSISSYKVREEVPLNQDVTATGYFVDDAGLSGNVLCAFYLLDDQNVLIDRADDQYTDSLGNFASRFPITEPDFKRGSTYQVKVVCGGATMISSFDVNQIESVSHLGQQSFDFLTMPENTDTIAIWIGLGAIIIAIIVGFVLLIKWGKR